MSDTGDMLPLGYTPAPLEQHSVSITFDVLARSTEEAAFIVRDTLVEDLVAPGREVVTDGERVFAEDVGQDVPSIRSWAPATPAGPASVPAGWEDLEDSGIAQTVASMFPPTPRAEDFRRPDGTVDQDAFDDADIDWRQECLELATQAARLPELLERLQRAEHARGAAVDLLEQEALPREPDRKDYLVTVAPSYEGEYESARYAWDHTQWQADFNAAATRREAALRDILAGDCAPESERDLGAGRERVPGDLLAVHALRTLVDPVHTDTPVGALLEERERQQLAMILEAGDAEVSVPDPEDPTAVPIYEGPPSEAHRWLIEGVYRATDLIGEGEFRLVVGRAPVGGEDLASAAFTPADHDGTALNAISATLEHMPTASAAPQTLHTVDAIVTATGRPGTSIELPHGAPTMLERGARLGDLLARRERSVEPDTPTQGTEGEPPPGRGF